MASARPKETIERSYTAIVVANERDGVACSRAWGEYEVFFFLVFFFSFPVIRGSIIQRPHSRALKSKFLGIGSCVLISP